VYINTAKQVGDADHIKVFSTADAAETWFEENEAVSSAVLTGTCAPPPPYTSSSRW